MSFIFTLSIIKPDAVKKNYIVPILNNIHNNGFLIVAIKMKMFSIEDAKVFYKMHINSLFFQSIILFMSSGPSLVMLLEKKNAIKDFRQLIGNTDPKKASKNTIRKIYGESLEKNAIHGSDNIESAIREIHLNFSLEEIFSSKKNLLF